MSIKIVLTVFGGLYYNSSNRWRNGKTINRTLRLRMKGMFL